MSGNDHLTDSAELRELRGSWSAVIIPEPPRIETITARGRARRRRRLGGAAGLSVAAAAAGTALALSLTGALGSAPARGTGTIRTAAFTILSNPNGTTTLTINPSELLDPATLQRDLAQDGIPAMVTVGSFCSSDPAPAGFSRVVSFQPAGETTVQEPSAEQPTITIDPAAMPAGTELSFGDFQLTAGEQQAAFALIDTSSYTCTSTPPGPAGPPGGAQLLYGGRTAS
ncbi:MAG TPA: hypothetical protein VKU77_08670 [Streptosporangiaceae bacterium]|nr:hypothetical protein [Streptosporangiaceae bacterium]